MSDIESTTTKTFERVLGGERPSVQTTSVLALSVLFVYIGSLSASIVGVELPYVREFAGTALLTVVPGVLLYLLSGRSGDRFGEFVLYAVGFSFLFLTFLNLLFFIIYYVTGFSALLSSPFLPIVLVVSTVGLLLGAVFRPQSKIPQIPSITVTDVKWGIVLLIALGIAVLAAHVMNSRGENVVMIFAILSLTFVVLFARLIPLSSYPFVIFTMAAAALLHRNLLTSHVIGTDLMMTVYLTELILEHGYWSPEFGGSMISLPIVTVIPVMHVVVADVELEMVYKATFAFVYALTPVGMYYLFREIFDAKTAFYGSLFFVFYHGTFIFTPDPQRIAQLFVVLLLMVLFLGEQNRLQDWVLASLFGFALIQTHYATSLMYICAFIGAILVLKIVYRYRGLNRAQPLSLTFALGMLLLTLVWYQFTSDVLMYRLMELPANVLTQVYYIVTLNFEALGGGTGAGVARQEWTIFQQAKIYIYALLGAIISYGLLEIAIEEFTGETPSELSHRGEFAALAVVLISFMGSSLFITADLDVDRVYQMTLIVLAVFIGVGYRRFTLRIKSIVQLISSQFRDEEIFRSESRSVDWRPLIALAVIVLLLNSGFIPYLAGTPLEATFDRQQQDYTYTDADFEGGEWLKTNSQVERETDVLEHVQRHEVADELQAEVVIFGDPYVTTMFRRFVPNEYYDATRQPLISPETDQLTVSDGYVAIRERGVVPDGEVAGKPHPVISFTEYETLNQRSNKIYTAGSFVIFETDDDSSPSVNGDGDGEDTAAVVESNETETEMNDTEETEVTNETEANETEETEESRVNETPNTTDSDIVVIEPEPESEPEDPDPSEEPESEQKLLSHT